MLRGALKPLGGEALLRQAGIAPERRAETLTVAEFVNLSHATRLDLSREAGEVNCG
jgi:16S rRNA (adenine1518-N6/adenine1519-N6)-dimethyltransferase